MGMEGRLQTEPLKSSRHLFRAANIVATRGFNLSVSGNLLDQRKVTAGIQEMCHARASKGMRSDLTEARGLRATPYDPIDSLGGEPAPLHVVTSPKSQEKGARLLIPDFNPADKRLSCVRRRSEGTPTKTFRVRDTELSDTVIPVVQVEGYDF